VEDKVFHPAAFFEGGSRMAGEHEACSWDRVAAELRAAREAQQRAWGTIDNATLGRYLADEVSTEERARVESALVELPELRKLTDLVRDVLNEFEPAEVPPPAVPEPAVLPWTPRPARRPVRRRWRQYAALAAAACLLVALGAVVPWSLEPASGPFGGQVAFVRDALPRMAAGVADHPLGDPLAAPQEDKAQREVVGRFRDADRFAWALEHEGKAPEAQQVLARAAAEANQLGIRLRQEGELAQAEPLLRQTYHYCEKKLGPEHPETVRCLTNLAGVYEVAVNATPATAAYEPRPTPPAPAALTVNEHPPTASRAGGEAPRGEPRAKHVAGEPAVQAARLREQITSQNARELRASVVPVLTQALRQAATPQERETLVRALGRLGPAARDAVPVLTARLETTTEPRERQAILSALGAMGPAARQAAPALVAFLHNPSPETRDGAALALVRMGPAARGVLPDLARDAKDKDALVVDVYRRLQGREGRIGVCDESECFSVKALDEAQQTIHTLAVKFDVEVLVETAPSLADAVVVQAEKSDRELGPRGIHLVIARGTPAVRVHVGEDLRKRGLADERLRRALERPLRKRDFDGALADGLRTVSRFEETHRQATP
jgi:hypothetical protein